MKRLLLMLLVIACMGIFPGAGSPLQTISFDETMKMDAIGDASLTINFALTASQWASWNQKYGQNKSLLKRDLGKLVSQYDTYDWNVQVNEMDRQVAVGVKAHGAVSYKGNGLYQFDVPKNWKGGQHNGNNVDYNTVEDLGNGGIAQYNVKVVLPPEAKDIKDDTGEAGERVLRYTVPVKSKAHYVLAAFGVLIMLGGAGVAALGLVIPMLLGGTKPAARGLVTASPAAPALGAGSAVRASPPQNNPPSQSL